MFGRLEDWARRHWPQAGKRAYAWSSMSYYPADLLGLYGRDPADFNNKVPNYIITGYHGQEFTGGCCEGSAPFSNNVCGLGGCHGGGCSGFVVFELSVLGRNSASLAICHGPIFFFASLTSRALCVCIWMPVQVPQLAVLWWPA